jgi:hypothetical protein
VQGGCGTGDAEGGGRAGKSPAGRGGGDEVDEKLAIGGAGLAGGGEREVVAGDFAGEVEAGAGEPEGGMEEEEGFDEGLEELPGEVAAAEVGELVGEGEVAVVRRGVAEEMVGEEDRGVEDAQQERAGDVAGGEECGEGADIEGVGEAAGGISKGRRVDGMGGLAEGAGGSSGSFVCAEEDSGEKDCAEGGVREDAGASVDAGRKGRGMAASGMRQSITLR